jgi:hypothetical protein
MASPEDIRYALFQQGIWSAQEFLECLHRNKKEALDEVFERQLCFGEIWFKEENKMETRNVKLTLEQAKEFYKKGGDLRTIALTAYTEEELIALPRYWEEFCRYNPIKEIEAYIGSGSGINRVCQSNERPRDMHHDQNVLPSKSAAKAHLALMKLHQLRDCYRQGWVPDWEDLNQEKYCIVAIGERQCKTIKCLRAKHFLSFQDQELAGKFLQCFVQEIYDARELL